MCDICKINGEVCCNCQPVCEKKKIENENVPRGTSGRINKDEYYLNIALAVSKRSTCLKRHYGCVIVKDDVIIATGYNGSPRGCVNCCDVGECQRKNVERYTGYERCPAVHAEQNALIAANFEELIGATVYLACETNEENVFVEDDSPIPCNICKHMLMNARVARVVNRKGTVNWEV